MKMMDWTCPVAALLALSGTGGLAEGLFEDVHVVKWPKGLYGYRGSMGDLILLKDNPLEDVGNIQKRDGVMVRGRWRTEQQLQSMLDGLVESYQPNLVERLWPLGLIALSIYMIVRKRRQPLKEQ